MTRSRSRQHPALAAVAARAASAGSPAVLFNVTHFGAGNGATPSAPATDIAPPTENDHVATETLAFQPAAEPTTDPIASRHARDTWAGLLSSLPPAQRTAIVLRHVDGLSYAEMAEALGRPEGTLKAQVHRGLASLQTAFLAARRREREEMTA